MVATAANPPVIHFFLRAFLISFSEPLEDPRFDDEELELEPRPFRDLPPVDRARRPRGGTDPSDSEP